jgi:hypothetical protein
MHIEAKRHQSARRSIFRRRQAPTYELNEPEGVVLGRRLAGERVLPLDGSGSFVWPFAQMCRHAVILGASGVGKTETAMRIAHDIATKIDAPVFYIDAKGDRASAERFCGLMSAAGRHPRVFPNERFDAWRGDWRAIVNRLLEVIKFAPEGPAAYYRDIAKTALQLACRHPDGPPGSSGALLRRLDYELLLNAHGRTTAALSLSPDKVNQVRMRYEAFFGQLGASLDGNWSFEDADAAYFLLDSVALGEDTVGAASLIFADFAHYFTARKRRDQLCVLFCDEFAAISSVSDIALTVEQARSFNTSLILAPQTISGIGGEAQRDRILGSVETVIAHAMNEPERVVALAGDKQCLELSHHLEGGTWSGRSTAMPRRQRKVDPDRIRALPVGTACVIRRGRAATVAIQRAPLTTGLALPEAEPIDHPVSGIEVRLPKEIPYLNEESEDRT